MQRHVRLPRTTLDCSALLSKVLIDHISFIQKYISTDSLRKRVNCDAMLCFVLQFSLF